MHEPQGKQYVVKMIAFAAEVLSTNQEVSI
jgi:hypothetical protein